MERFHEIYKEVNGFVLIINVMLHVYLFPLPLFYIARFTSNLVDAYARVATKDP